MQIVGIKFKKDGVIYNFSSEINLKKDDKVVVETERGWQLGVVANDNIENKNFKNLKPVERIATDEDYDTFLKNIKDAEDALIETRKIIKKLNLNMTLIDASYSLDRKQLLFNFVSDERVDFRELVKILASTYHTRIELHQVGVRDKAKYTGGIGLCGRELCCSSCLNNINAVNINMVKNQGIALNPTKINGACGRLLCCFNYENETYEENRNILPKIGEKIKYKGKNCEVVELNILKKSYKVKIDDNNIEEIKVND